MPLCLNLWSYGKWHGNPPLLNHLNLLNRIFFLQLMFSVVTLFFSLSYRYDSVTKDGQLIYQNQLNEYNKPFFDICDGLFANYSWQVRVSPFLLISNCEVIFPYLFSFHLNYPAGFIGRLSKAFSCCCRRAEVWCLHGYWCVWERHLWWWRMDCMSKIQAWKIFSHFNILLSIYHMLPLQCRLFTRLHICMINGSQIVEMS